MDACSTCTRTNVSKTTPTKTKRCVLVLVGLIGLRTNILQYHRHLSSNLLPTYVGSWRISLVLCSPRITGAFFHRSRHCKESKAARERGAWTTQARPYSSHIRCCMFIFTSLIAFRPEDTLVAKIFPWLHLSISDCDLCHLLSSTML